MTDELSAAKQVNAAELKGDDGRSYKIEAENAWDEGYKKGLERGRLEEARRNLTVRGVPWVDVGDGVSYVDVRLNDHGQDESRRLYPGDDMKLDVHGTGHVEASIDIEVR